MSGDGSNLTWMVWLVKNTSSSCSMNEVSPMGSVMDFLVYVRSSTMKEAFHCNNLNVQASQQSSQLNYLATCRMMNFPWVWSSKQNYWLGSVVHKQRCMPYTCLYINKGHFSKYCTCETYPVNDIVRNEVAQLQHTTGLPSKNTTSSVHSKQLLEIPSEFLFQGRNRMHYSLQCFSLQSPSHIIPPVLVINTCRKLQSAYLVNQELVWTEKQFLQYWVAKLSQHWRRPPLTLQLLPHLRLGPCYLEDEVIARELQEKISKGNQALLPKT